MAGLGAGLLIINSIEEKHYINATLYNKSDQIVPWVCKLQKVQECVHRLEYSNKNAANHALVRRCGENRFQIIF